MQIERIAECNTFDLHYAIIGLENQILVFLRVAILDKFCCTLQSAASEDMDQPGYSRSLDMISISSDFYSVRNALL